MGNQSAHHISIRDHLLMCLTRDKDIGSCVWKYWPWLWIEVCYPSFFLAQEDPVVSSDSKSKQLSITIIL